MKTRLILLACVCLLLSAFAAAAFSPPPVPLTTLGASVSVYNGSTQNPPLYEFSGSIESFVVRKQEYLPRQYVYSVEIDRGDGLSKAYYFTTYTTVAAFRMGP